MDNKKISTVQAKLDKATKNLNNRKLTDAILSAQEAAEYALAVCDYNSYATAQNVLGVTYVAMGNEMAAVDHYLKGLSCCYDHQIDALFPLFYINLGSRYQESDDHYTAIQYFLKANKCLENEACKADPRYKNWCLVNSLNLLISSNHQKDATLGEEFLKRSESYLSPEDQNTSLGTSLLIIKYRLYWYTGRKTYVIDHIDELISHLNRIYPNDLVQSIHELVYLLKEMKDYDRYKQVLNFFRKYAEEQNSLYYKISVCEFEMDYYRVIGDIDNYHAACVTHAELYMEQKKVHMKERTDSITQKILLQQKETERRAAEHQATTDPLTGLGNRSLLRSNLQSLLSSYSQDGESICIAMIDIDHFKEHNDTYGHIHGDECLKQVASLLRTQVGDLGTVYRFGGDEFVILFPPDSILSVRSIAEAIHRHPAFSRTHPDAGDYTLTLSQGYAICPILPDTTSGQLISKADSALYEVKKNGRNNYLFYED